MTPTNRRGFTLVEMLVVCLVLAVLAGIAVKRYIDLRHRALAAQATSDMDNIRLSAYSKFYDTGTWPSGAAAGVVPPELVPYLGTGFKFDRPDYTLEFENYAPPSGGPTGGLYQVAVKLTTSNQNLRNTLAQIVGTRSPYYMLGNDLIVVLVGPDGHS
jgi:prepilin-type N-terminal cleavage/methylation domain-containing protein